VEIRFRRLEGLESGDVTVVLLLVLDRWNVAVGAVQSPVVEPFRPFQSGQPDVVEPAPGPAAPNQLGLEQADQRLGGGVVVGVPDRADGGDRADLVPPFGVADGQVLGGFN
jgi:hypothetical protein